MLGLSGLWIKTLLALWISPWTSRAQVESLTASPPSTSSNAWQPSRETPQSLVLPSAVSVTGSWKRWCVDYPLYHWYSVYWRSGGVSQDPTGFFSKWFHKYSWNRTPGWLYIPVNYECFFFRNNILVLTGNWLKYISVNSCVKSRIFASVWGLLF